MAKGDKERAQQQVRDTQTNLTAEQKRIAEQNKRFEDQFNQSAQRGREQYDTIANGYNSYMNPNNEFNTSYRDFASGGRDISLDPYYRGQIDNALAGYNEFAETGGYRPGDIDAMRARAQGSIRSAYAGANRDIDRQKAVQGGYSPGYTAAKAKLTRDIGQNLSDSNINLEAALADQIRQGKLAGLAGVGNLAGSQEDRQMNIGNLNNQYRLAGTSGLEGVQRSGLAGMRDLYGTAPGETSLYAGILGNSNSQQAQYQQLQQQLSALMHNTSQGTDWWKKALQIAGAAAPYVAMAASDRNLKEDIEPVDKSVSERLKELPISTWRYKGQKEKHIGPMAQDFFQKFGVGDGKNLALVDVMGVVLASQKEQLANAGSD